MAWVALVLADIGPSGRAHRRGRERRASWAVMAAGAAAMAMAFDLLRRRITH
jgi:hypothetical protein